jgi:hypothetical protein
MEVLKNLSFSITLFVIGAIFILLGLSGGLSLADYSLAIQETWPRVIASLVGAILAGLGVYIEVRSKSLLGKPTAKEAEEQPGESRGLQAEVFFYTLDDSRAESFPNMVQDAVRLHILGRTMVNLLGQYGRVFEELSRSGCEVRLLFVDPSSEACRFLYGSNLEIYRSNIATTASHLERLRRVCGRQLQVKVTRHAPTSSIIIVEKQNLQQSFVQVQLYFLHSAVGWDRPIFRVTYGDKWYKTFQGEFNQLWSDSEEWNEAQLETTGIGEEDFDEQSQQ